jgi:hypothetical protein
LTEQSDNGGEHERIHTRLRWFRYLLTVVLAAGISFAAVLGAQNQIALIASVVISWVFFFAATLVVERMLIGVLKRSVGVVLLMGLTLLLATFAYVVGRVNT